MREIQISNADRDTVLGDRVQVADRWWPRLRGMIGHPEPSKGLCDAMSMIRLSRLETLLTRLAALRAALAADAVPVSEGT